MGILRVGHETFRSVWNVGCVHLIGDRAWPHADRTDCPGWPCRIGACRTSSGLNGWPPVGTHADGRPWHLVCLSVHLNWR